MIAVACPSCAKRFKTPDHFAGKSAKCPACGGRITIPAAAAPEAAQTPADDPLAALVSAAAPAAVDARPPKPVRAAPAAATPEPAPTTAPSPSGGPAGPTSGLAVGSLITSILGVGAPGLGVVGIVLGLLALRKINANPQKVGGRGVAIAGISVGAGSLVLWLLITIVVLLLLLLRGTKTVAAPAPPPAPPPVAAVVETPAPAAAPAPVPARPAPTEMYYFDLNTGKLFTGPISAVPPIEAPSGKLASGEEAGVKAYVFSCGDCADTSTHYIGWMEKADAVAKKMLENPEAGPGLDQIDQLIKTVEKGPLQISEDGKSWVSFTSKEGVELMNKARARCGGAEPTTCFP